MKRVVIGGESIQLSLQVETVPEEGLVEILAPKGSDGADFRVTTRVRSLPDSLNGSSLGDQSRRAE